MVAGGINVDVLAVSSRPCVAGTSNPGTTTRTAGGVARNIADNLIRLGTPTRLIGAVGEDSAAEEILAPLAALGVDVSGVRRTTGATGSYTAVLEHTGELVISVADMAATESLTPEDLDGLDADWLVLDANLRPATLRTALDRAGCPVLLDPVSTAKAERLSALEKLPVHTFTPDVAELAAFTGIESETDAVERCRRLGIQHVWVRDGARGSRFHTGGDVVEIPPVPGPLVDVTGAGDSMLAGYVHALSNGATTLEAARYGAALAALTIASHHSVRPGLTDAQVRQVLARQEVR